MNTLKTKAVSAKNHFQRNRGKYAFAAGFAACFAITVHARKDWDEFLKEHNLLDEFYTPEDED